MIIFSISYISTVLTDDIPDSLFNQNMTNRIKLNTRKDSYYLCSNGLAIKLISKHERKIVGRPFINLRSCYRNPMKSKLLDIFKSDGLSNRYTKRNERLFKNSLQVKLLLYLSEKLFYKKKTDISRRNVGFSQRIQGAVL